MQHQIRLAAKADKEKVLLFLKEQWNPNHIYLKSRTLFDYDLQEGDRLNFIIALNAENEIDGFLGFIAYEQELKDSDIFTVLWKVKPKSGDPTLGITLLQRLISDYGFRSVSTVGANGKTLPIYQFLGYTVGQLKHYFIGNDRLKQFSIAKNLPNIPISSFEDNSGWSLKEIKDFEVLPEHFPLESTDKIPKKPARYMEKRYFHHPFYSYKVLAILSPEGRMSGSMLITREVTHLDSRALRIVDFQGSTSDLKHIGAPLAGLLIENGYEYIDFYQYGIDHEIMSEAGFRLKEDFEELIIPNYFEPFEQKNVPINFFTTAQEGFLFFKADGDQDRPSQITNVNR